MRIEPFRIVAAHMRRRAVERVGAQSARAPSSVSGSGAKRAPSREPPRWRRHRARARARSMPSSTARGVSSPMSQADEALAAQRVVDEAGDGGAVAGTGEAMRQAPVLERVGRRPRPRLDVGEHFDRGGQARRLEGKSQLFFLRARLMAAAAMGASACRAARTCLRRSRAASRNCRPRNPLGTWPLSTQSSIRRSRSSSCSSR